MASSWRAQFAVPRASDVASSTPGGGRPPERVRPDGGLRHDPLVPVRMGRDGVCNPVPGGAPSAHVMARLLRSLAQPRLAFLLCAVFLAGCASAAAPAASRPPSAAPSFIASPSAAGSAAASGPIETPDEAARLVIASDSNFERVGKKDPDAIGQCCYYEAVRGQDGYRVRITMGWGDCPAGCIEHHTWTYAVSGDGVIELIGQSGDPVPPGGIPSG
jgi:hypothetical protein